MLLLLYYDSNLVQLSLPEPHRRVVEKLLLALKGKFGDRLVSLIVYGSVARGEVREDSDIDLLIVVDGLPRGRLKRQELFEEVERELEVEMNELWSKGFHVALSPIMKTPEEARRLSPLYLDMVEDAIIVYDKGDFFKGVLDRLREKLKEYGAKRVRMGRKWYWVLKDRYEFGEVIAFE